MLINVESSTRTRWFDVLFHYLIRSDGCRSNESMMWINSYSFSADDDMEAGRLLDYSVGSLIRFCELYVSEWRRRTIVSLLGITRRLRWHSHWLNRSGCGASNECRSFVLELLPLPCALTSDAVIFPLKIFVCPRCLLGRKRASERARGRERCLFSR